MAKFKIPETHPSYHPLWGNKDTEKEFKETLRQFKDKFSNRRMFEETELWLIWYSLLEKCLEVE